MNSPDCPLVVDLDGTLVNSDMLVENLFLFLRRYPSRIMVLFVWLFGGKAYLKRRLADSARPDVETLPYNKPLLEWLRQQRAAGVKLVLATASDIRIAQAVADHIGIFDEVMGTESHNLSSHRKQAALVERFGEGGYAYVGNSTADLPVWGSAAVIHVANPGRRLLASVDKLGAVGNIFTKRDVYWRTLSRALRLHQWAKNILVFVPLLASHRVLEIPLLVDGALAYLAFGACASSVYLLNDLLDLPDDRRHPTKRDRPLASGALPIIHSVVLVPLLLAIAFGLALLRLPSLFALVLAGYFTLTLLYSLWLKRVVMLDVVTLATLYTLRVIAGAAAMGLIATFWILAFCIFIFLSLAFVKRYTELHGGRESGKNSRSVGRDYYAADFELLASLGGASGYISVLVLALYINDASSAALYHSPKWMWAACPLLLFWLSRVWLLAHRGRMHEDPILFALRDPVSRWTGVLFVAAFVLAAL